jgi:hypothetical protein
VVKKASFSMVERGLVKKVSLIQQSGKERGQKVYFSMAGLGKKKKKKSPKGIKKVVKKLSNISSNLVKINKQENTNFSENWL